MSSTTSMSGAVRPMLNRLRASARRWAAVAPGTLSLFLVAGHAPLQCGREPDPAMRREDTAGDALWDLAAEFRSRGDTRAATDTLRYLVDKYPSSRFAPAAKEQLAAAGDAGP